MDGNQDRCLEQPGVAQSQEVVMAVDEVKLSRALVSLCAVVRKTLVIDH